MTFENLQSHEPSLVCPTPDINPEIPLDCPATQSAADPDPQNACASPMPDGGRFGEHLDPRVRPTLGESRATRINKIMADLVIIYPALDTLYNEARWLIMEQRGSRARGIFICGNNGSGKTSILKTLCREFPLEALQLNNTHQRRVLAVSMSGVRTTKAMLNRILVAAQVPIGRGRTIGDLEQIVIDTLRAMNCALLITDETQDVLQGRPSEQLRVIEVIKNLMNQLSLPVLALGTEDGKNAFRADPHMAARFEAYSLPNWTEGQDLADFLATYERYLPLKYRSDLARPEIQKVLVKKTGGVLDLMLKRLRWAAIRAVIDGAERINKAALEADLPRPPVDVLVNAKHDVLS